MGSLIHSGRHYHFAWWKKYLMFSLLDPAISAAFKLGGNYRSCRGNQLSGFRGSHRCSHPSFSWHNNYSEDVKHKGPQHVCKMPEVTVTLANEWEKANFLCSVCVRERVHVGVCFPSSLKQITALTLNPITF